MPFEPSAFDNVKVLRTRFDPQRPPPHDIQELLIVSGVAIVFFRAKPGDWTRDTLSFLLPDEGSGKPKPLVLTAKEVNSAAIVPSAFPATIEYGGSAENAGWGVDAVDAYREKDNIRVNARVVVRGPTSILTRVGFHVTLSGTKLAS